MTEAELLKAVTKRCDDLGLYWYHNFDWRTGKMAGWPDMVIVGHGMLFRELKSAGEPVKANQSDCGRRISAAGGNWAVWRPADLESGHIQRELRELAECPMHATRPPEMASNYVRVLPE
jgi:hypothetical protein